MLVVVQIVLGFAADNAERPLSSFLLDQHVRNGLLIATLTVLRLSWRIAHPPPPRLHSIPIWQHISAAIVQFMLYLLLFALAVSGYVLWAWIGRRLDWFANLSIPILFHGGDDETWRSIAGYVHSYAGLFLIALVILHVVAALWHEFVKRDKLISSRML